MCSDVSQAGDARFSFCFEIPSPAVACLKNDDTHDT